MDLNIRNVGLMGRMGNPQVVESLRQIIRFLAAHNLNIILESSIAETINHETGLHLQECRLKLLGEVCDLVIVVGGDGCLLGAARALAKHGTPVLGVNRGRLGFLTDVHPKRIESDLSELLAGRYSLESRFLLDCAIKRKGSRVGYGDALNDVVLHPSEAVQMLEFDLYIEGQFVYTQRSDGLIVATPTGSTAYALSGGGPIMHPSLDAIALVPMFPHMLASRPLVVNGNSEIKIIIGPCRTTPPQISCDGQPGIQLEVGDVVYITKKPHKLKLVHLLEHSFYEACRSKLGWSSNSHDKGM